MSHHHHHHTNLTHINQTFRLAVLLNLAFVAIEAYYGWRAHSLALVADAGHNLSDVASLLLAWLGIWALQWTANETHTYGWQKLSVMASVINALLLLAAMGYLGYEAIIRLTETPALNGSMVAWVAGIGIFINGLTAWLLLKDSHQDMNIRAAFLHMLADTLVSVGVLVSGLLILWFNINWIDSLLTLIIALVVIISTWSLFTQALHLSFDGVPNHLSYQQIHHYLHNLPGVIQIDKLHIWALSTQQNALSVHLTIAAHIDRDQLLNDIQHHLMHHYAITHSTIQMQGEQVSNTLNKTH